MASGAVLGGGYDGPDRRIRLTQQFDQLEAVAAWHVKVSQDEIGLEPGRQGETIQPIVRLPHDLNAQERLQDVAQEGHAYVAVVHNHDANLACRGGCRVIWCEIVAHDTGTIGYTCVSRYQVNPVFSASALPETKGLRGGEEALLGGSLRPRRENNPGRRQATLPLAVKAEQSDCG